MYTGDTGKAERNLAFQAISADTKELRSQKQQRMEKLKAELDQAREGATEHSWFKKDPEALKALTAVLAKHSGSLAQIHCGRTAQHTLFEESGHPVQAGAVHVLYQVMQAATHLPLLSGEAVWRLLGRHIEQLEEATEEMEALSGFGGDKQRNAITDYANALAGRLSLLESGNNLSLPVGPPRSGMFLRMQRRQDDKGYDLFLYNGSADAMGQVESQQEGVTAQLRPLMVFEAVTADELFYLDSSQKPRSPLLAQLIALTVRHVDGAKQSHLMRLLGPLQPKRVASNKHIEFFMRNQRANFSSQKSLNGFMLQLCGKDHAAYKRLSIDVRALTLVAALRDEGDLASLEAGPRRAQLRAAANNILKSVYQYTGQEVLSFEEARSLLGTALDALERLDEADACAHKQQEALSSSDVKDSRAAERQEAAQEAVADFRHPKIESDPGRMNVSFKRVPAATRDPKEFLSNLEQFKQVFDGLLKDERLAGVAGSWPKVKRLSGDGMRAVDAYMAELPSPLDTDFWDAVPLADLKECLEILGVMNERYSEALATNGQEGASQGRPCSAVQQLTLYNLYANLHKLCVRIDAHSDLPVLTDFSLDVSRFRDALDCDPLQTLESHHLLKRRRDLETYFYESAISKKHHKLFNWSKLSLEPGGADKELYQVIAQRASMKCEGLQKIAKRWVEADETTGILEAIGGAREQLVHARILRMLHMDRGRNHIQGYQNRCGYYPEYEQTSIDRDSIKVTFKEQGAFVDLAPKSVLEEHFPHLALLKRASLSAAVLLDVDATEAPTPAAVDVYGKPIEEEESSYGRREKKWTTLTQSLNAENMHLEEVEKGKQRVLQLTYFGRMLTYSDKERVKDRTRYFTAAQHSQVGVKAVKNGEHTGMFRAQAYMHRTQNQALSTLGSKLPADQKLQPGWELAELMSAGEVNAHTILHWLRRHPKAMENQYQRARLWTLLFRPQYGRDFKGPGVALIDQLERDPDHLLVQLRNLVAEGVTRYYLAQPSKRPVVEPLLFLLELAQQVERNHLEIHGTRCNPPLYDVQLFEQLTHLQEGAKPYSAKERVLLQLCEFTHLFPHAKPEKCSEQELLEATRAFIELTDAGIHHMKKELGARRLTLLDEGGTQLVGEFLRRRAEEGSGQGFEERYCAYLSDAFKLPPLRLAKMEKDGLPILTGRDSGGATWDINLKSGKIFYDGRATTLGGQPPSDDPFWVHLLGKTKHSYRTAGRRLYFQDHRYGEMRSAKKSTLYRTQSKAELQRKLGGCWYTAVKPDADVLNGIVPKTLRAGLTHWIAEDPKVNGIAVLICDRSSGQARYIQTADGTLRAVDPKRPWNGTVEGLKELSQTAVMRRATNESHFARLAGTRSFIGLGAPNCERIVFPEISDQNGRPLRFERRDGRWVLSADPSFALAETQLDGIFFHHNQYVVLEKVKDPSQQRILMVEGELRSNAYDPKIEIRPGSSDPWSSRAQVAQLRSYRVQRGQLIGESLEDTLYLASQYLVGKDYTRAMRLLRTVGTGARLTGRSAELIVKLLKSEAAASDYSPDACAVRLRALWVLTTLLPDFKVPVIAERRTVRDLFADYCAGIKRMPGALRLTEQELQDLRDQCGIGSIPTDLITWTEDSVSGRATEAHPWKKGKFIPRLPPVPEERPEKINPRLTADGVLRAFVSEIPGESAWPLFGEKELSAQQFYALYETFRANQLSELERDEVAYRLTQAFPNRLQEKQDGSTITRLNILWTLYRDKARAAVPPLPEKRSDLKAWWQWNKEFQQHYKKEHKKQNFYRYAPDLADDASVRNLKSEKVQGSEAKPLVDLAVTDISSLEGSPTLKADAALGTIQSTYFDEEQAKPQVQALEPLKAPRAESLPESQKQYAEAVKREFASYNKDVELHRKQDLDAPVFTLKSDADIEQLKKDLERVLDPEKGLEAELFRKEEDIVDLLVRQRSTSTVEELKATAKTLSPLIKRPSLHAIVRAAVKGTEAAYRELNPYLSTEAIQELHHQVLELMRGHTTLQQIKRARSELVKWDKAGQEAEKQSHWQLAVEALTAPRTYKVDTWAQLHAERYNLYFEYKTGMRVRQKQQDLITGIMQALQSGDEIKSNMVFQLIMGGGKTSVILSVLLDLVAEMDQKIATLVLHESQFDAVLGNLQKYQKERFGKELIAVECSRRDLNDVVKVRRLLATIKRAKKDRNGIAMRSNLPQTLLLELRTIGVQIREKNLAQADLEVTEERSKLLGEILYLLREEAVFLTDEVDMVYNIIQQLNFPMGSKQHLSAGRVRLTRDLFLAMYTQGLMRIGADATQIDKATYQAEFIDKLADASLQQRDVPEEHHAAYKRYVCNSIDARMEQIAFGKLEADDLSPKEQEDVAYLAYLNGEEIDPKEAGLQALSRFMISSVLQQVLGQEADRHIGYHPDGSGKVIPFLGRKNPAKTELANPDEAVAAGALCALNLGIPRPALQSLARVMAEAAEGHALAYGDFDATPEAQQFLAMTGVALGRARSGHDIDKIEAFLSERPEARLKVQAALDLELVTYRNSFLTAEAYDIPNLAAGNITCTGTPQSKDSFDRVRHAELDAGTEGKILEKLRLQGKERAVLVLEDEGEKSASDAFLDLIAADDAREERSGRVGALIDTGGVLKGVTGAEFARAYLKRFKGDPERNAVVFFHRFGNQASFAVLRRNDQGEIDPKPIPIPDTTPGSLENLDVDMDKMFVVFEESKTTGVDFKLSATCRGLLTFNPVDQTFRKTAQGALRMRGLWFGQALEHVIPQSHLGYYKDKTLSVDAILATSLVNQATEKARNVGRSLRERIRHVPKRMAQKALIEAARQGKIAKHVEVYGDYLDTRFEEDLLKQFGRLTDMVPTQEHLKEVQQEELARFPDGDRALKDEVEAAHKVLLEEAEHAMTGGYLAEKMEALSRGPGFGTQVQVEAQLEQQQEQQQEQQVQVQVEQERQNEINFYQAKQTLSAAVEEPLKGLDALQGELPKGYVAVTEYLEANKTRYYKERCYSEVFKGVPLFFSENFTRTVTEGDSFGALPVFSDAHKKIAHLLVTADGSLMALSHGEFEQWKEKIDVWGDQKPYWIVNLDGELAAGSGEIINGRSYRFGNAIQDSEAFKNALWHANLFNGHLLALERQRVQTRERMLAGGEEMTEARRDFLDVRCGEDGSLRRQLTSSDCLNPLQEHAEVHDRADFVEDKIAGEDADVVRSRRAIRSVKPKKQRKQPPRVEAFMETETTEVVTRKAWMDVEEPPQVVERRHATMETVSEEVTYQPPLVESDSEQDVVEEEQDELELSLDDASTREPVVHRSLDTLTVEETEEDPASLVVDQEPVVREAPNRLGGRKVEVKEPVIKEASSEQERVRLTVGQLFVRIVTSILFGVPGVGFIFGSIKALVDLGRRASVRRRIKQIREQQQAVERDDAASLEGRVQPVDKSDADALAPELVVAGLSIEDAMRLQKLQAQEKHLSIALKADGLAMIPFAGMGLYWAKVDSEKR